MEILMRTFAAREAYDPAERARLNLDALTSEYMPSHRYLIREPFHNHPNQRWISHTFRTRKEAESWIANR